MGGYSPPFFSLYEIAIEGLMAMASGNSVSRRIGLFLTMSLFLTQSLITCNALAFPYQPQTGLTIISEYTDPGGGGFLPSRTWEVVPAREANTGFLIWRADDGRGQEPICDVSFLTFPAGQGQILWKGLAQVQTRSSTNGLLVIPGFPAPCDILPVEEEGCGKIYREETRAGGRLFKKWYRVICTEVSPEQALDNGWIKSDVADPCNLQMLTVVDGHDCLIVRQLWSRGGAWWLYEETPLRRSWLVR